MKFTVFSDQSHKACKEAGNMTHNNKKNQPIENTQKWQNLVTG